MITALLTFRSQQQKWPQEQVYQGVVTALLADLMIGYSIVLNIHAFMTNYVNVNIELNVFALLPVAGF
ncbi:hypothetical protein GZH53_15960 [Flavihumibacter sp. R14]|nr:hypothetical protein [Flavihumibacter soli]